MKLVTGVKPEDMSLSKSNPMNYEEEDAGSAHEDEVICSVCWESLAEQELVVTKCGHGFHKLCLEHWVKTKRQETRMSEPGCKKSCPFCKSSLKMSRCRRFHPSIRSKSQAEPTVPKDKFDELQREYTLLDGMYAKLRKETRVQQTETEISMPFGFQPLCWLLLAYGVVLLILPFKYVMLMTCTHSYF